MQRLTMTMLLNSLSLDGTMTMKSMNLLQLKNLTNSKTPTKKVC